MSLNTVSVTGRLTAQPEVKYFDTGAVCANFRLAVADYVKGEEQTSFIPVEVWGKTAEYTANYVNKGDLVGISGGLKQDQWNDKGSGEARSKLYIRAARLELLRRVNDPAKEVGGVEEDPTEEF